MKIIALSDTHKKHEYIKLEESDILLHSGDYSSSRFTMEKDFIDFIKWFEKQPAKYKIFISGNHDFMTYENKEKALKIIKEAGLIYLEDNSIVIDGLKIHGSPWTPPFYNWAYMKEENDLFELYEKTIDNNIDILITHGPAYGILDKVLRGEHVGSKALKAKIEDLKNLKLHIFGHIHESYGHEKFRDIDFYNVSSVKLNYQLRNSYYRVINI